MRILAQNKADNMTAVIYARYSSHGQNEQSIEGQLEDCYKFAEQCGYKVVGEYIDRALSGKYDDREDFLRMIQDSAKGHFAFVIVWKFDRFARNRYDSAIYKHRLKKSAVRVISAKEPISDTPEGVLLEAMLEANAEYYSLNLAQNVKRGQRISIKNGTFVGGHLLFGYKKYDVIVDGEQKKRVAIDERSADIVRFIFEQYAAGVSKKQIVDELNKRGCLNWSGKPFHINNFQHTLTNAKYTGEFVYGGKYISDSMYPQIISRELFDKVQERLKANARAPAAASARVDYKLQGKGYCGHCGAPLVGHGGTSKTGKMHRYYACAVEKKKHTCEKYPERKGFLEWYVVEQTLLYVLHPKRIEYIAERVVAEYEREYDVSALKSLEGRIATVDANINKAVDAMIEASSSAARKGIDAKIAELEVLRDGLKLDLAKAKIAAQARITKDDVLGFIKQFANGDPLDDEFQSRVIDTFINAIYLSNDKIVIYFNAYDCKQVSYIEASEDANDGFDDYDDGQGVQTSKHPPRQQKRHYIWCLFCF